MKAVHENEYFIIQVRKTKSKNFLNVDDITLWNIWIVGERLKIASVCTTISKGKLVIKKIIFKIIEKTTSI